MNLEPLLTIAEVATAFAGFASLVTIVATRGIETWTRGPRIRFMLMIYMSLSSILFSLLPFTFLYFELPTTMVWRLSGGILGLYLAVILVLISPSVIRLVQDAELNLAVSASTWLLGAAAAVIQFLALLDIVQASLGTYFLGTLYFLFLSGVSFLRLVVLSIWPATDADESG